MKIKFGMGVVKSKRSGLGIIKKASAIKINIIDKKEIDISKSVTALMPNFIHSLDASCIHELTNILILILSDKIVNEYNDLTAKSKRNGYISESELSVHDQMRLNYLYISDNQSDYLSKDNTYFDDTLVKDVSTQYLGVIKNNIPLYTIHDCFATTPNNMYLIKKNVSLLFSEMYFNVPCLKIVHESLLRQLLGSLDVFAYPIEYDDSKEIKDFKKVLIKSNKIIKIDNDFINHDNVYEYKYYLFVTPNGKDKVLIPFFPDLIKNNIKTYKELLSEKSKLSHYLIS